MRRLLLNWLLFVAALPAAAQAPAPIWPAERWEQATPEQMGMDSRALALLVEYGGNAQMDSMVITRHGRLVLEASYAPFQPAMLHRINSATKGVVAALTGIAIAEGRLPGPESLLQDLLPEARALGTDPQQPGITLQHLLDMTSGIAWTEPLSDAPPTSLIALQRSPVWVDYILRQPMATAPGSSFNYNSGNSHLLSAVLARHTGMPTEQYATAKLFGPIGIRDFRWRRDPQGVNIGGWGLYLRTADMARIAHLYAQGGVWNGRPVVPRAWVERVFQARTDMFAGSLWRYADQWWTLPQRGAYLAVGYNRQLIIAMPALGVAAAFTGRTHYPIENVIAHLERAARSEAPLPADAEGQRTLQAQVARFATEAALEPPPALPPLAARVSGRRYAFPDNPEGLRKLSLRFEAQPRYLLEGVRQGRPFSLDLPLGLDGRFAAGAGPEGTIATKATWLNEDTLEVTQRQPEEGATVQYRLRFGDGVVELSRVGPRGAQRVAIGEQQ